MADPMIEGLLADVVEDRPDFIAIRDEIATRLHDVPLASWSAEDRCAFEVAVTMLRAMGTIERTCRYWLAKEATS